MCENRNAFSNFDRIVRDGWSHNGGAANRRLRRKITHKYIALQSLQVFDLDTEFGTALEEENASRSPDNDRSRLNGSASTPCRASDSLTVIIGGTDSVPNSIRQTS